MADKLDYTIQIDGQQYDVTAADSLHADLTNQVEKALVVKKSVRKDLADIENNLSLNINTENGTNNLRADISVPEGIKDIGVKSEAERKGTNSFAYKGDIESTLDIVPSSGGVFTGPIYAPDINAGDGFNVNKFQVTNYNSVDTIIRELKGFPVYEWKRTTEPQVEALTAVTLKESEDGPPTMLPFKVVVYKTGGFWNANNLKKLKFTNCTTACNFLIINADESDTDEYGRTLLGTYTPNGSPLCTYVELRVEEADHANDATNVTDSIGSMLLRSIFVYNDSDIITPQVKNAANADVAVKLGTADKGNQTKPIYLQGGVATECLDYAGGTLVQLNDAPKSAQVAEFFAPITAGQTTQVLIGKGDNAAPSWTNISDLSVSHAETADSATTASTVTTNISNQPIANIFKAASSGTGISTVVKNADISDKLFIYPVGGTSSSPNVGEPNASGNYIYYGENMPDNSAGTADFRKTGNIYIKIES